MQKFKQIKREKWSLSNSPKTAKLNCQNGLRGAPEIDCIKRGILLRANKSETLQYSSYAMGF